MKARLLLMGLFRSVSALASTDPRSFAAATSASTIAPTMTTIRSSSSSTTAHRRFQSPRSTSTALSSYNNHLRHASSASYSQSNSQNYNPNNHDYENSPPQQQQLTLRLARRADVPAMQRCNLATLPENYNEQFYVSHLQQWPELALVVCMPTVETTLEAEQQWTGGPLAGNSNNKETVVAYVLGKLEDRPMALEDSLHHHHHDDYDNTRWYEGSNSRNKYTQQLHTRITMIPYGHVTSLAVLDSFRRQGLARELMMQLHAHMAWYYGHKTSRVGLHVRAGNVAATRLYANVFGYQVMERIPQYYQDGEDGLLMEMDLINQPPRQDTTFLGNLWGRKSPWKNQQVLYGAEDAPAVDLSLPRQVGSVPSDYQQQRRQGEQAEPMHMRY